MPHLVDWLAAAGVATLLVVEWWVMRLIYRKRLAASNARRLHEQQSADRLLSQARQQAKQLQQEIAILRPLAMRAARHVTKPGSDVAAANASLAEPPASASPVRPALPVDGFADTLPAHQFASRSG